MGCKFVHTLEILHDFPDPALKHHVVEDPWTIIVFCFIFTSVMRCSC
jgi:hypothetical protein